MRRDEPRRDDRHRPATWLRRVVGLVTICVVLAGTSGCTPEVEKPGPVLLVGDSIFFLAGSDMLYTLRAHGWTTQEAAYPGAGIRGGGYVPLNWPARMHDLVNSVRPKVVVVELGTNGCQGCPSLAAAIDQDMQSLRAVPHVLWLTTNTQGPRAAQGKTVNAALEDATKRWHNLELLRYDEWMRNRTDLVPANDVHPTPAGNVAIAKHIDGALQTRSQGWARNHSGLGVGLLALVVLFAVTRKKPAKR